MRNDAVAALGLERCREIFDQARAAAKSLGVGDLETLIGAREEALTRFANNGIHQNVSEQTRWLAVRAVIGQRTARATTNRWDRESIRRAVEEAIGLTKAVAPNPDLLPLAEASPIAAVPRFDAATAAATPGERAHAVAAGICEVRAASQTAAGIYSTASGVEAVFNTAGVAAWHCETHARAAISAMAEDSSGWVKASASARQAIDLPAMAATACRKARLSQHPREIEPGHYTVVLEPSATLDLIGQMFGDFSGTALEDRRSFLNGRMGGRVFGENINIHDDVAHPLQAGAPFDGEGVPRRRLALVEAGVPREVAWARASARKAGVEPTGHGFPLPNEIGEAPVNIVIEGGRTPLEEMIASTARGILVTRFWYIREVDPYEKIMTGMTRDGTFLIEDGAVTCGLKNLRFNQSLIHLLNNVEAISPAARASGEEALDMVAPAIKARDFHFTEATRF